MPLLTVQMAMVHSISKLVRAGLKGTLTDGATKATFSLEKGALDAGKKVTIGGKEYTIGAEAKDGQALVDAKAADGNKITVNDKEYIYKTDKWTDGTNAVKVGTGATDGEIIIGAGDTVSDGNKTLTVMTDAKNTDGTAGKDEIDDTDSSVITAKKAIELMKNELLAANKIGVDDDSIPAVTVEAPTAYDAAKATAFTITKGNAKVADRLSFNLHVGSDADMTNKIGVNIETMNSSYLGIKGLNVADDSGNAATYAIDAIKMNYMLFCGCLLPLQTETIVYKMLHYVLYTGNSQLMGSVFPGKGLK